MSSTGLSKVYCALIRSVLCYGAPVFYQFLSDTTKSKLEHVQDISTRIIFPHVKSKSFVSSDSFYVLFRIENLNLVPLPLKHKKWDFLTLIVILFARHQSNIFKRSLLHILSKEWGLLWPNTKTVLSAYAYKVDNTGRCRKSSINIWNKVGARTEPWRTSTLIGRVWESAPFKETNWWWLLRNDLIIWSDKPLILNVFSLQSNALLKSRKIPTTYLTIF